LTQKELESKLSEIRNLFCENEIVEFKEAKNSYDFRKRGKYFSALSNEANLNYKRCSWLVFGIEDKQKNIIGTNFRLDLKKLHSLKGEIANKTTQRITFIEIHELLIPEGRVIMFQIPPAPNGIPVAFEGHYYGRDGEELAPLNIEEIERIRNQAVLDDWSVETITDANIGDLNTKAIAIARINFKSKFPDKASEVDSWNNAKFLDKAKITIKGRITKAAILLLGKEESESFINPAEAKIRWVLKDSRGNDKDYAIEGCPLLLAVDKIYNKIRNLKYRYLQDGTLFPDEVDQYEPFIIREAINNCIAHQDYSKGGRINVVELEDHLVFSNLGSFIPGSVEKVVIEDAPEEQYRNKFLAAAMFNLKMVDTAGGGIRKMFNFQRDRFFPMPHYDLSDNKVKVTIIGKVVDIDYARVLARNADLSLEEIIMLDKVQKKESVSMDEIKHLRTKKLIEGRKPNFYISAQIAGSIGQKASYTKNRALDKQYYMDLIINAIKQHQYVSRADVDELLWSKLPDWMTDIQRKNKIKNLLHELSKNRKIINDGTPKNPIWKLY